MTQPSSKPIEFATDSTWTSGPDTGQPTRVAASAAEQKQGMIGGNEYPASKFNYQLGVISDHVRAMSENHLRGWESIAVGAFAIDDVLHGVFAYSRGAEKVPRVVVFGSDAAETGQVSRWFRTPREWNGNSWAPGASGSLRELAANVDGSILVGVGLLMSNQCVYSTDGSVYVKTNTHTTVDYQSVCFHDGAFYAAPQTGATIGKSADGISWTATTSPSGTNKKLIRSGKTTGGVPCVLAATATQSWISTDGGVSWSAGPAAQFSAVDIQYSAGAGLWMAVSALLRVCVSADGLNWTETRAASIPSGPGFNQGVLNLATDGGGAWVVGGNSVAGELPGGFVAYSVDAGVTWRFEPLDNEDSQRVQVCHSAAEGRFYAVCHDLAGGRAPLVFRSRAYGQAGGMVL
jgi:hypothetical protein